MQDESMWIERAQSAEAQLETMRQSQGAAIERIKVFKTNFGIKELANGEIQVDFDKLVDRIGIESAIELRGVIDEKYDISGQSGEKPRIKIAV